MMTTVVIKNIMPRIDIVTTMAVDMVIALAPDPTPHVSGYYIAIITLLRIFFFLSDVSEIIDSFVFLSSSVKHKQF